MSVHTPQTPPQDIYRQILNGERNRFPRGFWTKEGAYDRAVACMQYLFEQVYQWSYEDIRWHLQKEIFIENKLAAMLKELFQNSPYAAINAVYPGMFRPSDLATYRTRVS